MTDDDDDDDVIGDSTHEDELPADVVVGSFGVSRPATERRPSGTDCERTLLIALYSRSCAAWNTLRLHDM